MPRVINMPKFWVYRKVLNVGWFPICNRYTAFWINRMCLDRVLNISWVLNMSGFWIWQGSEYAKVTQGSKYTTIWLNVSFREWVCLNMSEFTIIDRVLNMYDTIHNARSLQVNGYLLKDRHIENPVKNLR